MNKPAHGSRLAVFLCLVPPVALAQSPSPAPAAAPTAAAPTAEADSVSVRRGSVDFERFCVSCHGKAGDGHGTNGRQFTLPATNFTAGMYKCRSTPSGSLPTDADLRRSIEQGLAGSGMPAFVALNPLQLDDLVATLKHLSPRFAKESAGAPIGVPEEPSNGADSVQRGARVYERMKCANCHGTRGEGGPQAGVTDFTRRSSGKCGNSAAALYVMLMVGLDGTPMASYAEELSPAESWDLVHYLQSLQE